MPPRARLTNISCKILPEGEEQFSTVIIEATAPSPLVVDYPAPLTCRVTLQASLNMYPGPLYVQDGIIREIKVEPDDGQVAFIITLDADV
ncbi:MAG: hypothetical protein H5T99_02690, partial [Moorella sp. (in: Bacteria)]|nr:hypothetical protein [Moorella sp. (in: firmicutes)]